MAINWSGAGGGALTGASAGAALGPWGALGGGVLGGLLGFLSGGDEEDEFSQLQTGTPEQQALHNQILAQAMGMNQQGGGYQNAQNYYNSLFQPGNQAYENFAAPYMNQFNEQILPQIAERFAGAGALSSSGFGQSLGAAGAGLQAQLAQLFASLQNQAAGSLTNQYNQLATTGLGNEQFAYKRKPASAGFAAPFLAGLSGEMGKTGANLAAKGISDLFKPKATAATGGIT